MFFFIAAALVAMATAQDCQTSTYSVSKSAVGKVSLEISSDDLTLPAITWNTGAAGQFQFSVTVSSAEAAEDLIDTIAATSTVTLKLRDSVSSSNDAEANADFSGVSRAVPAAAAFLALIGLATLPASMQRKSAILVAFLALSWVCLAACTTTVTSVEITAPDNFDCAGTKCTVKCPAFSTANLASDSATGAGTKNTESLTFTCASGYTASGTSTCNLGSWSPATCEAISCASTGYTGTAGSCQCAAGYHGTVTYANGAPTGCTANVCTCADSNGAAATGTDCTTHNKAICTCSSGFTPSPGKTKCYIVCPAGKIANSDNTVCVENDECATKPCGGQNTCTDVVAPGTGYSCTCGTGYEATTVEGKPGCKDIDACAGVDCGAGAQCYDKPPPHTDYKCDCPKGYAASSGTCVAYDACAELGNPCGQGTCVDDDPPSMGNTCTCPTGYELVSTSIHHTCGIAGGFAITAMAYAGFDDRYKANNWAGLKDRKPNAVYGQDNFALPYTTSAIVALNPFCDAVADIKYDFPQVTDPAANFKQMSGCYMDYFAIAFTGTLYAPTTGIYKFNTWADDAADLFIDNVKVVEDGDLHGPRWAKTGGVEHYLEKGPHAVTSHICEYGGGIAYEVHWIVPGETWTFANGAGSASIIPASAFKPPEGPE